MIRHTRAAARHGFTLVEIMIVVAIIAVLAAIAVPSAMRARKRSQATSMLKDLQVLNDAIDVYAIENGKSQTDTFDGNVLRAYVKKDSTLYANLRGNVYYDRLGNFYRATGIISDGIGLEAASFAALSDVAPAEFWAPYHIDAAGTPP